MRLVLLSTSLFLFSGCYFVSDEDLQKRRDRDEDGVLGDVDCDDLDAEAGEEGFYYADVDGDGVGGAQVYEGCSPPDGYVQRTGDCNDSNPLVSPDVVEFCDEQDNDCNGLVDDGAEPDTWYEDIDGDGFGISGRIQVACDQPWGFAPNPADCDDGAPSVNPLAQEVCSGQDDDCDGLVDADDPDMMGEAVWYRDSDGDGFGDTEDTLTGCTQPAGYVRADGDCDDDDASTNPSALDYCDDGIDQDCTGVADDPELPILWYRDEDGDGLGDPNNKIIDNECDPPDGYVPRPLDCDDTNADISADAIEVCDGLDNDCDGLVDDADAIEDGEVFYRDADGDGFGLDDDSTTACAAPTGYADNAGDCDDAAGAVNPDASEVCDGIDNDCDGDFDDEDADATGLSTWYADADGDGFGADSDATDACSAPPAHVSSAGDCDDGDGAINPDAADLCGDGIDQDCSGTADDGTGDIDWFLDSDGDGYGDPGDVVSVSDCSSPAGRVPNSRDCDDGSSSVSPSAPEVCDGVDNNCDSEVDDDDNDLTDGTTWYRDADGDLFGDASATTSACDQPSNYVADSTDCDDSDAAVNPAADEVCFNGVDDDCNGPADNWASVDASNFWLDGDDDGYGLSGQQVRRCVEPPGYADNSDDCDDTAASVNPGAVEVPYDGTDQDCDGLEQCDVDGDGYDENGAYCLGLDCDDTDPLVLECLPSFPYTPGNVDPDDYDPVDTIDFTGCSGSFVFDSSTGTYSQDWTDCTATPAPDVVAMSTGIAYVIPTLGWTQPTGRDVRFSGAHPVIVLVYGDATVDGDIDAGTTGTDAGAGADGPLCVGARLGQNGTDGDHGGGGGGGGGAAADAGDGGRGGDDLTEGAGGPAGIALGISMAEPLHGGCSGGAGGEGKEGASGFAAAGLGGGAVQFSVSDSLTLSGGVWAGGGAGAHGVEERGGGGGGGGGGAIVLQADTLQVSGRLGAAGGGGGAGIKKDPPGAALDGSRLTRPAGGAGVDDAEYPDGGDGGWRVADATDGVWPDNNDSGGGGGGGAQGAVHLLGHSSCSLGSMTASPSPSLDCP